MTMSATTSEPRTTATATVSVHGISMIYPDPVQALNDIDLDAPTGELTTLLGPSGYGKTTLLKIIAGLLRPATGTVSVNGRPINDPGPERTFVFQDFTLLP